MRLMPITLFHCASVICVKLSVRGAPVTRGVRLISRSSRVLVDEGLPPDVVGLVGHHEGHTDAAVAGHEIADIDPPVGDPPGDRRAHPRELDVQRALLHARLSGGEMAKPTSRCAETSSGEREKPS